MRTLYYVNGKRADLGRYLSAGITNDYYRDIAKKAKKYYEKHPEDIEKALMWAKDESTAAYELIRYYQDNTEEGRRLSEDFVTNMDREVRKAAGCGLLFFAIIILGCIILIMCEVS